MSNLDEQESAQKLSKVLGLYKAEWLNEALFSLFNEPTYFNLLKTQRPCVLIGGRGTGKTTVLRGLSYEGQLALNGDTSIAEWPFYGLYYRVNTNRVTAFRGADITEERWRSYFSHYINLSFCQQLLDFVAWYERHVHIKIILSNSDLKRLAVVLGLPAIENIDQLSEELEYSVLEFESSINTIADNPPEFLSTLAAPIDILTQALAKTSQFAGRQFYFLIDEFENFEDYQQRVLNTVIKHANNNYTFKIGVRELGWRQRATLNASEQLTSPADYALISIAESLNDSRFSAFAERVITSRIASVFPNLDQNLATPQNLLPGLSELEEAEILLGSEGRKVLVDELAQYLSRDEMKRVENIASGHLYFFRTHKQAIPSEYAENVRSWLSDSKAWKTRLDNHFYASLFSIRKGKRGIRKYYCGWDIYVSLANSNIRYLLELVHAAFVRHIESEGSAYEAISAKSQTEAAEEIGRKNLSELEGLSVDGAKLTKLVLSLGRIFQVMASDSAGHTPEVNQFHLRQSALNDEIDLNARRLLDQCVMHLALVRSQGNKLMSEADTQDYDYRLHPIFAPLFVFGHRKKRKLALASAQILGLVERPREYIRDVLAQNNRTDSEALPDQLQLFGEYYAGN